jgi:hypothetical protein
MLAQEVSFLNKASIKSTLSRLPSNSRVTVDATQSEYIDFDVKDIIMDFYNNQAPEKGIEMTLVGFKDTYIPQEDAVVTSQPVLTEA